MNLETWLSENSVWETYDPVKGIQRLTLNMQRVIRALIESVHARIADGFYRGDLSPMNIKVTLHLKVCLPETTTLSPCDFYTDGLELFLTSRLKSTGYTSTELENFLLRVGEIAKLSRPATDTTDERMRMHAQGMYRDSRPRRVQMLDKLQKLFYDPFLQGANERAIFPLRARTLLRNYYGEFARRYVKDIFTSWEGHYKSYDNTKYTQAEILVIVKADPILTLSAQNIKAGERYSHLDFVAFTLVHLNEELKKKKKPLMSDKEMERLLFPLFPNAWECLYSFLAGDLISNELLFNLKPFRGRWGGLTEKKRDLDT